LDKKRFTFLISYSDFTDFAAGKDPVLDAVLDDRLP
jgi:hypothetical protein